MSTGAPRGSRVTGVFALGRPWAEAGPGLAEPLGKATQGNPKPIAALG